MHHKFYTNQIIYKQKLLKPEIFTKKTRMSHAAAYRVSAGRSTAISEHLFVKVFVFCMQHMLSLDYMSRNLEVDINKTHKKSIPSAARMQPGHC